MNNTKTTKNFINLMGKRITLVVKHRPVEVEANRARFR